jgi:hypothetical protein
MWSKGLTRSRVAQDSLEKASSNKCPTKAHPCQSLSKPKKAQKYPRKAYQHKSLGETTYKVSLSLSLSLSLPKVRHIDLGVGGPKAY